MSGPKVVRIVTREEIEAICRRHIAAVAFAAEELRRRAGRCGMLDSRLEQAILSRLASFEAMFAAERWMDIQKGAPEAASFMLSEADRLETSATAIAAKARERGRRAADAARSLVSALKSASVPVPAGLLAASQGKAASPEEAESVVSSSLSLIPAAQDDPAARAARQELAQRLGIGETGRTVDELIAASSAQPTAIERRLDMLIAELGVLDGAADFAARADNVMLTADPARRALLADSLVLDAASHVASLRRREAAACSLREARASIADLVGAEVDALRERIASSLKSDVNGSQDELVGAAAAMVKVNAKAVAAAARRRAVLSGLAALGYEVRETMASAWERDGRLVVRKRGTSDYGVELGAPADVARLQVRLVGSDRPSVPRTARSDADQETIWCREFDRLRARLSVSGDEMVVEKALRPGEQPLRSVTMTEPAEDGNSVAGRAPAEMRRS